MSTQNKPNQLDICRDALDLNTSPIGCIVSLAIVAMPLLLM